MKLFNTASKLERQRELYYILKEEILDIDLKGSAEEFTNFKIAELAERLANKGVRVESGAQGGRPRRVAPTVQYRERKKV